MTNVEMNTHYHQKAGMAMPCTRCERGGEEARPNGRSHLWLAAAYTEVHHEWNPRPTVSLTPAALTASAMSLILYCGQEERGRVDRREK